MDWSVAPSVNHWLRRHLWNSRFSPPLGLDDTRKVTSGGEEGQRAGPSGIGVLGVGSRSCLVVFANRSLPLARTYSDIQYQSRECEVSHTKKPLESSRAGTRGPMGWNVFDLSVFMVQAIGNETCAGAGC